MNATDVVKEVMKAKGYSCATLAKKMGYSTPSYVSERLRRPNGMRSDLLVAMLNAMDCDIIVKDRIGEKQKWVIENDVEVAE